MYDILNIDASGLPLFLEPNSVQCCVTSPPYFGLRDYGVDGQIGMEATPDEFVQRLVGVFRGVRDVLRDDGTCWVNMGDSYATDGRKGRAHMGNGKNSAYSTWSVRTGPGIKQKDLIGVPWMLAFALRADGWYLRQGIVWEKPNAMPESVRDRCASSHEFIFLLSKSERYYFDHEAIKEDAVGKNHHDLTGGRYTPPGQVSHTGSRKNEERAPDGKRNKRSVWRVATRPYKGAHFATFPPDLIEPCILAGSRPGDLVLDPFMGSGTTAQVALQHGRRAIGCEINPDYIQLAHDRIAKALPQREVA